MYSYIAAVKCAVISSNKAAYDCTIECAQYCAHRRTLFTSVKCTVISANESSHLSTF